MPEPGTTARVVLWRAYVPQWAHDPLSGAGAARFGGRWNTVGQPCLYTARELSTAWAEYNQGFVQHPATIAQLILTDARLADLTHPAVLTDFMATDLIHRSEWRDTLDRGQEPETHMLTARLMTSGYHGVIYPSFMSRGGTCVALWRWNDDGQPQLEVIDPDHRLPKGPASWL